MGTINDIDYHIPPKVIIEILILHGVERVLTFRLISKYINNILIESKHIIKSSDRKLRIFSQLANNKTEYKIIHNMKNTHYIKKIASMNGPINMNKCTCKNIVDHLIGHCDGNHKSTREISLNMLKVIILNPHSSRKIYIKSKNNKEKLYYNICDHIKKIINT
jgi:hypothetical protein